MAFLFDPGSIVSIVVILVVVFWVYRIVVRVFRRMRAGADADSRRYRMLNEIPSELRFRVYDRDMHQCQRCGTFSDLIVDFVDEPPLEGPVRLDDLTTFCARCAVIEHQSSKMQ